MRDYLRVKRLEPYRRGMGPRFVLATWATNRTDGRGQTCIGYALRQIEGGERRTVFEGEDFSGSPMNADDSDENLGSLLGFLTLRPGDTDSEYFDSYTSDQLAFADAHAESLSMCALELEGELT